MIWKICLLQCLFFFPKILKNLRACLKVLNKLTIILKKKNMHGNQLWKLFRKTVPVHGLTLCKDKKSKKFSYK